MKLKNKIIMYIFLFSLSATASADLDSKAKSTCKSEASGLSEQFINIAFNNADFLDKASISGSKEAYISLIGDVCVAGYAAAKNKSPRDLMDAEAKKISSSLDNPTLASGVYYAYFYGTGIYTRLTDK